MGVISIQSQATLYLFNVTYRKSFLLTELARKEFWKICHTKAMLVCLPLLLCWKNTFSS